MRNSGGRRELEQEECRNKLYQKPGFSCKLKRNLEKEEILKGIEERTGELRREDGFKGRWDSIQGSFMAASQTTFLARNIDKYKYLKFQIN